MDDPFNLNRFIDAQESTYGTALAEVRSGQKRTHWMWYIFPQLRGLGTSPTARKYGITSLAEAQAFLEHPVLGPRLIEISQAALRHVTRTANEIFGTPDDMKLRSCATLFAQISEDDSVFHGLIEHFFRGQLDERTRELVRASEGN